MDLEQRQFNRLLRSFASRLFDNELLGPGGDSRQGAAHVLALLAALSIAVSYFTFMKYYFWVGNVSRATLDAIWWGDREFIISLGMAAVALTAVVSWDSLFPDRRDCLILSGLPIRMSVFFRAKLTAVLSGFVLVAAATNAATAIVLPLLTHPAGAGGLALLRNFAAHIVAVGSASVFVFFLFLGLQGALINVLSYRLFRRISAWIQMVCLFTILLVFFFIPPIAAPGLLVHPANRTAIGLLPPFWFLGLYQTILGSPDPVVRWLAWRACAGLLIAGAASIFLYTAGYPRYVRKTIEESGVVPEGRRRDGSVLSGLLDRWLLREPHERAAFHFIWRTMTRNATHRMILAVYVAVGLTWVLAGMASLFKAGGVEQFRRLNIVVSGVPIILPFFLLLGMRVLFTMPVELRANWVFRLTEDAPPAAYVAGARKLMVLVGVLPVALAAWPVFGFLWGWDMALRHTLLSVLIALLTIEFLMRGFQKIPFTCSFLPGKANLQVMFGVWAALFCGGATTLLLIELELAKRWQRVGMVTLLAVALLAFLRYRRRREERLDAGVMYEERSDWWMTRIEFQR